MSGGTGPGSRVPREEDAQRIVERALGGRVATIARFPTGHAHYVYDVVMADGRRCVARLSRPNLRDAAIGAAYWHARLALLGVPLPALYYADPAGDRDGFPVLVMERLPGTDLGAVYPTLTPGQKRTLAERIAEVQIRVGSLPRGRGFGYATSYDDRRLAPRWRAALDRELRRSRERLRTAGLFDPALADPVQALVDARSSYIDRVEPRAYLDDTTTKNVIVAGGRLSGIVDTDYVAFGDQLMPLALTRASLLHSGYDTDYTDAWADALDLAATERSMVTIYTALYIVDFLSGMGHAFNREAPEAVDHAAAARLHRLHQELVRQAAEGA
jgi:hypothetical protein